MKEDLPIKVRAFKKADEKYVLATWKRTLKDDPTCAWVPDKIYFAEYNPRCDKTLRNKCCLVAVSTENPDFIVGWLCYDDNVLHYAFVRDEYRKLGVFKALAKQAFQGEKTVYASFWTDSMQAFENSAIEYIYRPALARTLGGYATVRRWEWEKVHDY